MRCFCLTSKLITITAVRPYPITPFHALSSLGIIETFMSRGIVKAQKNAVKRKKSSSFSCIAEFNLKHHHVPRCIFNNDDVALFVFLSYFGS